MGSSGARSGGLSQRSREDKESQCSWRAGTEYLAGAKGLDPWLRAVGAGGDQGDDTVEVRQGLRGKKERV